MVIIGGIDPGRSGGFVLLEAGTSELPRVLEVHLVPLHLFDGKQKPDFAVMCNEWLPKLKTCSHVFIEKVGAMPGQGVTSMFSFGYVAGFMDCLVKAAMVPHTFLTPQGWKKVVGISGSDKDVSRRRATQLFPASADAFKRKKDDGPAEAALIAYSGFIKNIAGTPAWVAP